MLNNIMNDQRRFNGGYLFLQDIYYELGIHKICRAISSRHTFEYDLNDILSRLIYTRILFPASKKSSFEDSKRFIEQPSFELHVFIVPSLLLQKNRIREKTEIHENGQVKTVELEQKLIVSYSIKYRDYLRSIRNGQIERAEKMIARGEGSTSRKRPNDPKRLIATDHCTQEGEVAEKATSYIDQKRIDEEEKYDGFYAVCVSDFLKCPAFDLTDCPSIAHFSVR